MGMGYWEGEDEGAEKLRVGYWEDGDEDTGDTGRMRTLGGRRRGCLGPWGHTGSPPLYPHGPTVTPCPPAGPRGRGGATWRSARGQRTGCWPPARAGERLVGHGEGGLGGIGAGSAFQTPQTSLKKPPNPIFVVDLTKSMRFGEPGGGSCWAGRAAARFLCALKAAACVPSNPLGFPSSPVPVALTLPLSLLLAAMGSWNPGAPPATPPPRQVQVWLPARGLCGAAGGASPPRGGGSQPRFPPAGEPGAEPAAAAGRLPPGRGPRRRGPGPHPPETRRRPLPLVLRGLPLLRAAVGTAPHGPRGHPKSLRVARGGSRGWLSATGHLAGGTQGAPGASAPCREPPLLLRTGPTASPL